MSLQDFQSATHRVNEVLMFWDAESKDSELLKFKNRKNELLRTAVII